MVSLQAIENALYTSAPKKGWKVRDDGPSLGVIAKEFPGGKPLLKLVSTFPTDIDEINQALRDSGFSSLIRINDVIQMEEIPLMGTGKVNYRVLEEEYLIETKKTDL